MIVRVSGSDDALRSPAFQGPLERSSRYVKEFRYLTRDAGDANALTGAQLLIRIDFDPQLIEGLLREHNFPVWGRERPSSLLVISYDVNENIRLVADDTAPDLVEALDAAAVRHAVPVLFPLMDLQDISMIDIGDIASRHFERIGRMAVRYQPNAILVGQIIGRSGEGWRGNWEVRFAEQIFRWEYQAPSKNAVVNQVIAHLARILALEYALEDHRSVGQSLLLSVSALSDIGNLVAVQQYLESLNAVDSARVALINRDVVTYRLELRNAPEDLQRLIEFGNVLEQEDFPQVLTGGQEQIILNYSFVGRGVGN